MINGSDCQRSIVASSGRKKVAGSMFVNRLQKVEGSGLVYTGWKGMAYGKVIPSLLIPLSDRRFLVRYWFLARGSTALLRRRK